MIWSTAAPALGAAFAASLVEAVEAFTIVLAAATLRGWRPPALGTAAGIGVLTLGIALFGPLLDRVPLQALQLTIGVLLLLFGLGWLRKAALRAAGVISLHDEAAIFEKEVGGASGGDLRDSDWLAATMAFKAVVLEGLEVVFIVIAVGAGRGLLIPAGLGALGACVLVLIVGALVHRPLSRVPENTLKFGVGVMLSAFGVFWTGEGLGIDWPSHDAALVAFAALFLGTALAAAAIVRRPTLEVAR
jgi:Ca2+/H+ antiporter, TMEM165/GDT1 family